MEIISEYVFEITQFKSKTAGMRCSRYRIAVKKCIQQRDEHGKIDQPEYDPKDGIDDVFRKIMV